MSAGALALTVFCCVSGGPYGLEEVISASGPGLGLLLIIVIPLLWALPDSLTTAELAPAIPVEGGYVVWVRRAMGPFFGFLNAWWTWLYALTDAAVYPVMFTTYASQLLITFCGYRGLEENSLLRWTVGVSVVGLLTLLNVRGTRLVGRTSSAFALLIIAPFAVLAAIGLFKYVQHPTPVVMQFLPEGQSLGGALSSGLALILWNYLGWDALSTIAGEVEEPQRAYPRAIFIGVPLVTLVYLLPTLAGLAHFRDASKWVEGSWPQIAQAVGGPWLGTWVNIVALVSPIALFTASLLGSSRVPLVLAETGFLPRALEEIHPRFGTPWKAILLCGGIYAVLIQNSFKDLIELNVLLYGAALMLESAALLVLRKKEPELHRPFKIPGGWPVLWLVFLLPFSLVIVLIALSVREEGWDKQWFALSLIASGPVVYLAVTGWQRLRPQA